MSKTRRFSHRDRARRTADVLAYYAEPGGPMSDRTITSQARSAAVEAREYAEGAREYAEGARECAVEARECAVGARRNAGEVRLYAEQALSQGWKQ